MDRAVDSTFEMQRAEILQKLLNFEKNEELLSQLIFLIPTESFPEFAHQARYTYEYSEGTEAAQEGEEEYYDCTEDFNEMDRLVPTGEELRDWREILELDEFEDAPENYQELLEIALGEQRRAPSI